MRLTCHPSISRAVTPDVLPPNAWPGPKGSAHNARDREPVRPVVAVDVLERLIVVHVEEARRGRRRE